MDSFAPVFISSTTTDVWDPLFFFCHLQPLLWALAKGGAPWRCAGNHGRDSAERSSPSPRRPVAMAPTGGTEGAPTRPPKTARGGAAGPPSRSPENRRRAVRKGATPALTHLRCCRLRPRRRGPAGSAPPVLDLLAKFRFREGR
jgi:hypothetical protein